MIKPKKKVTKPTYSDVSIKEYGKYAVASSKLSEYSFKDVYGGQFNPPTYTSNNTSVSYGATGATGPAPVKPMTAQERDESIAEIASQIENTIADFIPESSKSLPVDIAKAVVAVLFEEHFNNLMKPIDHESMYLRAEQSVADKIKKMTMEEYAKERNRLLGKSASPVSPQMSLFDVGESSENI